MTAKDSDADTESQKPVRLPWFQIVRDQGIVNEEVINYPYEGSGTEDDPYIVEWIENDPRNPMLFPNWVKWSLTQVVAIATLAVAFVSSAYSGGINQIVIEFGASDEVATLGISLFVMGFVIGPLIWAPMSELYGRQYLFIGTYALLTVFNAAACGAQNMPTLIILRFFAGAFGSSPLTNAGGVIADIFPATQRGLALTLFAAAPFLGPTIGPVVGGFVGETIGWRWIEGIMAIFTGIVCIVGTCVIPETYPPVLLRQRALRLTKLSNGTSIYKSRLDAEQGVVTAAQAFKTSLSRPWVLLFLEPIVFLLSIYMAIIYGTLYMLFASYPIVFQEAHGWSQGIGGLPFLGVAVGMILAIFYAIWDNRRYIRVCNSNPSGTAPPESRLPVCCVGGIAVPIGLFWFAWTNYPSIHYMVCITAALPFGFGMVLIFLGIMNYLIDSYTIFAASVLAANAVLRSLFGAVFPLFTGVMYTNLGIHWASTIPAFLALICVPFPFLFYKFGPAIRLRCKYAAEAAQFLDKIRGDQKKDEEEEEETSSSSSLDEKLAATGETTTKEQEKAPETKERHTGPSERWIDGADKQREHYLARREKERDEEREQEDVEDWDENQPGPSPGSNRSSESSDPRFHPIKATAEKSDNYTLPVVGGRSNSSRPVSMRSGVSGGQYDWSPWDIDRVNTRDSFQSSIKSGKGKKWIYGL